MGALEYDEEPATMTRDDAPGVTRARNGAGIGASKQVTLAVEMAKARDVRSTEYP